MGISVRKAVADQPNRAQTSRTASVPAPVGGWDAQSPLAAMPNQNASILDNFIPRPGYLELRKGSFLQAGAIAQGDVKTLMTWRGVTDKLLACAGTSIYDVTASGTNNPAALYSAATSPLWEWTNFANSAGTWTIAVNGADTPIKFDGTTITTTVFTWAGSPSLTMSNLSLIMTHKRRLHMGEAGTLHVWFPTSVDAIAGALGLLDLGPVFTKGGTLACMGTTSLNYGTGLDDFAVYITTQGQVAMYQGTDPGDATKWALVGVYDLGYPMGPRSLVKYGSDLCIITTDGVIPLSQAIRLDRAQDDAVALTQKIQNAFHTATACHPAGQGWQGLLYSKGSLAIFNIPSSPAVQYVQNVQTGAWCRFTGMDAACWGVANGLAYFGSGASVNLWDVGADDNGVQILYDLNGAFSDFRSKGQKRFTMLRPLMIAPGWITPALEVDVDYRESAPTATPIVLDVSNLNGVARYDWSSVSGIGYVGAVRMRIMIATIPQTFLAVDSLDVDEVVTGDGYSIVTQDPIPAIPFQLTSFDLMFESGGLL
jgi:hypothetical protein